MVQGYEKICDPHMIGCAPEPCNDPFPSFGGKRHDLHKKKKPKCEALRGRMHHPENEERLAADDLGWCHQICRIRDAVVNSGIKRCHVLFGIFMFVFVYIENHGQTKTMCVRTDDPFELFTFVGNAIWAIVVILVPGVEHLTPTSFWSFVVIGAEMLSLYWAIRRAFAVETILHRAHVLQILLAGYTGTFCLSFVLRLYQNARLQDAAERASFFFKLKHLF